MKAPTRSQFPHLHVLGSTIHDLDTFLQQLQATASKFHTVALERDFGSMTPEQAENKRYKKPMLRWKIKSD